MGDIIYGWPLSFFPLLLLASIFIGLFQLNLGTCDDYGKYLGYASFLLGLCLLATLPRKLFSCGWLQKPPRAMPIDPLRSHLKITAHSSGLTPSSVQPSHFGVEWLCCCWPKNYRACTKKCNTY